jgi:hypothetical protein
VAEIIQNPDGYSVADDGTAPFAPPAGIAISGLETATGLMRIARVTAAGALVTTGGGGGGGTPVPNEAAVTMQTVTVAVAGTPVQGPNLTIPDGFGVVIKNRSTQAGSPQAYVSDSAVNAVLSANRFEMLKGESIEYKITNMNLLFFDTDTNGTIIDLTAEQ